MIDLLFDAIALQTSWLFLYYQGKLPFVATDMKLTKSGIADERIIGS